jgi:hypothetical protein
MDRNEYRVLVYTTEAEDFFNDPDHPGFRRKLKSEGMCGHVRILPDEARTDGKSILAEGDEYILRMNVGWGRDWIKGAFWRYQSDPFGWVAPEHDKTKVPRVWHSWWENALVWSFMIFVWLLGIIAIPIALTGLGVILTLGWIMLVMILNDCHDEYKWGTGRFPFMEYLSHSDPVDTRREGDNMWYGEWTYSEPSFH